ncbi:MAG: HAD family phosphatase [Bacillota bacterium]|nr:HAD family phosphatase [Bacillota bacterium]
MIKGILFDMDGLMIDSEVVTFHLLQKILKEKGYILTRDMYLNLLGKTKKTCESIFKEWYGKDFDYWTMSNQLAPLLNESLRENLPIKEGLFDLLEYCKKQGYSTCIATSSLRSKLEYILPKKLLSYFDATICADEVNNGKPNPEVFFKACQKLNILPQEALVLEDSEAGIEASLAGNIRVICIPDMKEASDAHKAKCEKYLSNLKEVIFYLEQEKKDCKKRC